MHIPNEALMKINDKSISNRPALQKLGKLCQHVEAEGQSFSDRALPETWKVSVTSIGKPGFSQTKFPATFSHEMSVHRGEQEIGVFQLDMKQETVAHAKIVRFLEGATMCQAVELVDRLNDSLLKDIEFIRERDATREAEIDSLIAEL